MGKGNKSPKRKKKRMETKKIGRNPKCDRDWIKIQRKKGNKGPKRNGKINFQREIKVQIEKENKSPKRIWKK